MKNKKIIYIASGVTIILAMSIGVFFVLENSKNETRKEKQIYTTKKEKVNEPKISEEETIPSEEKNTRQEERIISPSGIEAFTKNKNDGSNYIIIKKGDEEITIDNDYTTEKSNPIIFSKLEFSKDEEYLKYISTEQKTQWTIGRIYDIKNEKEIREINSPGDFQFIKNGEYLYDCKIDYSKRDSYAKIFKAPSFDLIQNIDIDKNLSINIECEYNKETNEFIVYQLDNDKNKLKIYRNALDELSNLDNSDISNWKTYKDDKFGFEFKYPNYFTKEKNKYYYFDLNGDKIGIHIDILNEKLTPDTVKSLFGNVEEESLNEIIVDNKTSYYFNDGDMGAGGNSYRIPLSNYTTLSMWFVSEGGNYDYDDDIISTIKTHDAPIIGKSLIIKETEFDNCKQNDEYKDYSWYKKLENQIRIYNITSPNEQKISNICLSSNNLTLLALTEGSYCTAGNIFQYDIAMDTLIKAVFNDKNRGCVSWPEEFGEREGPIIHLEGFGGDAGCGGTMYYDYNYITNVIELKKECSKCEGETKERCNDY
jgi:hypothetical protein